LEEVLGRLASPETQHTDLEVKLKVPEGLVKLSRKTRGGLKCGAWAFAVFIGLLGPLMLGPSRACAQMEIDPDHFDSPNTEPFLQPPPAESRVTEIHRDDTFSLPRRIADRPGKGQLQRFREVMLRHSPIRSFPISWRLLSVKLRSSGTNLTKLAVFVRDGG
jgi:hypothetical protein